MIMETQMIVICKQHATHVLPPVHMYQLYCNACDLPDDPQACRVYVEY